jgi:hypothetical protein
MRRKRNPCDELIECDYECGDVSAATSATAAIVLRNKEMDRVCILVYRYVDMKYK